MTNARQYLIEWADKAEAWEKRTIVNTQDIDFDWHADHVVTSLARNSFRPLIKLIRWATEECNECRAELEPYGEYGEWVTQNGERCWIRIACPHCTPFLESIAKDLPELPE